MGYLGFVYFSVNIKICVELDIHMLPYGLSNVEIPVVEDAKCNEYYTTNPQGGEQAIFPSMVRKVQEFNCWQVYKLAS